VRASRLLRIMLLLHTRGRVSARDLAAELEVSLRTVYRDVEALGAAGVPVYATRGRAGGFQLLDGYRTRLTGLTPDEADALFLAGLPDVAADLGLGLATPEIKLLAALPPDLRERAGRVRDRFHLDAPGWLREPESPPFLPALAAAVWQERRVQVRYERSNRAVVDRVLEPLGLVLKGGAWYAVANAVANAVADAGATSVTGSGGGSAGPPRTYRAARVHGAAVLDERFARPAGFRLADHWSAYQRDYEQRLFRGEATVRLSPAGRDLLFLVGSAAARAGHAAMGPPDAGGWCTTTIPIESERHAVHALLQLGADAEVLAPASLRTAVSAALADAAARYAEPDAVPAPSPRLRRSAPD
jgi:predicted DNA-binding transcriptional regulator YafY